jgi:hypothetical protein
MLITIIGGFAVGYIGTHAFEMPITEFMVFFKVYLARKFGPQDTDRSYSTAFTSTLSSTRHPLCWQS